MTPQPRTPVVAFAVVLALLVAAGLWWSGFFVPDNAVAPPAEDAAAILARAQAANAGDAVKTATESGNPAAVRTEAVPSIATDSATGSLLLHVRRGANQEPAIDFPVRLWRSGVDNLFETMHATTNAAGDALFESVAPGNVFPEPGRGNEAEFVKVDIVAGQRTEATLLLNIGIDVRGRVVDVAGTGIADAEVVHAGWGGGKTALLTHTAADGTFALRGIERQCHLGARKAGMRPSAMRQLNAGEGATVDCLLVLEGDGAALRGVVLGPEGGPVVGAVVTAGSGGQNMHNLPDGGRAIAPQPIDVRTDEHGRFHLSSLAPGKLPLLVRSRTYAPWQEVVDVVVGRTDERTIHLQAGVVLHGVVRDSAGAAVAKADVVVELDQAIGWRSTTSAADGSFRIAALPAGSLPVRAEHGKAGKAKATLVAAIGQTVPWDPVLALGLQLRGRIVDDAGKPKLGVIVEGSIERRRRGDKWDAYATSDVEGRFVLDNCIAERTVRLQFRHLSTFPELTLHGVLPGPNELLVTMPTKGWVHIRGTVCGPDGERVGNVIVMPLLKDSFSGTPAETVDAQTGEFRLGPYPPGTYAIRIEGDGFPPISVTERACAGGETWDLGELRFERSGRLVVQPVVAGEMPKLDMRILRAGGFWPESLEAAGSVFRSGPLPAGTHVLTVTGTGIATQQVSCEVRVGAETRLDVPLAVGHEVTFAATVPAEATTVRVLELVVLQAGAEIWNGRIGARDGSFGMKLSLGPGSYEVAVTADGVRGVAPFVVTSQPITVSVALTAR